MWIGGGVGYFEMFIVGSWFRSFRVLWNIVGGMWLWIVFYYLFVWVRV